MRCFLRLAAAALAFFSVDALAVTKCVDKAGKVTYQDGKCPDDSTQGALKTPIGPAPGPNAAAPGEASANDEQALVELASVPATFEGCEKASPGFTQKFRADLDAWRAYNAAALSRHERTPAYQQVLENGRNQVRTQFMTVPGAMEKLAKFCEVQFIPAFRNTFPR